MAKKTQSKNETTRQAPPLKGKEKEEARIWEARLQEGLKHVQPHRDAGQEVFDAMTGSSSNFVDDEGNEIEDNQGLVQIELPLLKNLIDSVLPQVLANEPGFFHKPSIAQDDDLNGLAGVLDHLIGAALRECQFLDQSQMCGKEGMIWSFAAMEVDYDGEVGLPRATWHTQDRIRFDPRCNGLERNMQWASVDFDVPIEHARKKYDAPWLKADLSSVSRDDEEEAERHKVDPKTVGDDIASPVLDLKRLVRIWVRGDSPTVDDTDDSSAQLESEEKESGGLKGKNEMIIWDPKEKRVVHREPWPFVLDIGRLPIFFFVPERFPGKLATVGTFELFVDLQNKLNWLYSFIAGGVKNGAASKFFYDKAKVSDENIAEKLTSIENLQGIGIDMTDIRSVDDVIKFIQMEGVSDTALQGLNLLLGAFESATQSSDLRAEGVAGIQKATTATIADQRVRNRLAQIAKRMERFVTEIIKAMSQIARAVMSFEDVQKWVPSAILSKRETLQNPDGSISVEITPYWPDRSIKDKNFVELIRGEMDIEVHPGSLREQTVNELLQNEIFVFQTLMASLNDANAVLNKSGREISPAKIVGAINHFAVRVGELLPGISTTPYQIGGDDVVQLQPSVGPGELQIPPEQAQQLEQASIDDQLKVLLGLSQQAAQ